MAKAQDTRTNNEEMEAKLAEFSNKIEVLRVRYEQYFMGIEKAAPAVMRMDVARLVRDFEQANVKNTALKFKIRQSIQKFTSYSTYWNRVLREIEDGTYKRHKDKVKRTQAVEETSRSHSAPEPQVADAKKTRDVSDEASAFLASLGIESKFADKKAKPAEPAEPAKPVVAQSTPAATQSQRTPAIRRPAIVGARPAIVGASQDAAAKTAQNSTSSPAIAKPVIHSSQNAASSSTQAPSVARPATPSVQTPSVARPAIKPSAAPAQDTVQKPVVRPAIVGAKPAIRPAVHTPAAPAAPAKPATPAAPAKPAAPAVPPKPAMPTAAPKPAAPAIPPRVGVPSLNKPGAPKPPGLPGLPRIPGK